MRAAAITIIIIITWFQRTCCFLHHYFPLVVIIIYCIEHKIALVFYRKVKVKVASDFSCPCGLYSPWNSPGQNTGVGCQSLLQGIFPTQESNQGLLHCRRIQENKYYVIVYPSPRISHTTLSFPTSPSLFAPLCQSSNLTGLFGIQWTSLKMVVK